MKNNSVALCHIDSFNLRSTRSFSSNFGPKTIFLFVLLLTTSAKLFAQTESTYQVVDKSDEQKKICWPQVNTSKTEATTDKMKTDPGPNAAPASGGLAPFRSLFTAVEVPNSFPPPTIEIYDLLGNPLIINGTAIQFNLSTVASFKADSTLGTTQNYHWVGYMSNPFQPDNQGVYYYNIFHRWTTNMPCHYESLGGRQWNSDNSGHANYSDTTFDPHPVLASIIQPVSCYGANNGVIKFNTHPLNYYTFTLNGGNPTINNTFSSLAAGTYTLTITDSFFNSCDTVITLPQPPSAGTSISVSNCGNYTWATNGLTYNSSGVYIFNATSAAGCPKQDTLILNITSNAINSNTVTAYNAFTWPVNGVTYTSSGNYFFTSTSTTGCQTSSVLHLTIINTPFNMNLAIDQPISCFGNNDGSCQATAFPASLVYFYQLDGGVQSNTTGFFQNLSIGTHTVCAFNGSSSVCKTVTFVNPLPLNVSIVTDSIVSCLGNDGGFSAIISGGTNISQSYLTFWTNSSNVLLNPVPNNFDTYITGLVPGVYHLLVEDDNGCTKSVTKVMNAAPPLNVTAIAPPIHCFGGTTSIIPSSIGGVPPISYTMFGFPLGTNYPAGSYEITATDSRGCTATTMVDFGQPAQLTSTLTTTECTSYYWSMNGTTYTASGTYFAMLTSIAGCTIMNILNLTISQNTTASLSITACNSYLWSQTNATYTNSGTYTATSLNSSGCLHTTTLHLTINHSNTSSSNTVACNSFNWTVAGASNPYNVSGVYTATSLNSSGCLHTDTLHLTINHSTTAAQTVVACNAYTWTVPGAGNTYTASGNYTATSLNSSGCLHTDTLHLTINHSTTAAQTVIACNSFTWNTPGTGITYSASGNYTAASLNALGCTHTDTLHLSIKHSTSSTVSVTANNAYTWTANNITYSLSGNYTATLINSVGCDSLLTLQLTVNSNSSVLNLRCFIEAYMEDIGLMKPVLDNQLQPTSINACDTIIVELHNPVTPFATVVAAKSVLNRDGFTTCNFPPLSGNYYIAIKHRNALETWSSVPVFISSTPANYNFTNAASKAYGANQLEASPGVWAFFSGDVNHDENIDLIDVSIVEQDISNFANGYMGTDVNGDGNVDLLDSPFLETNLSNFIFSVHP